MNIKEWNNLSTEEQFEIYFKYLSEHCDTCNAKLNNGKCLNKKWWNVFHTVRHDTTWTLFCN